MSHQEPDFSLVVTSLRRGERDNLDRLAEVLGTTSTALTRAALRFAMDMESALVYYIKHDRPLGDQPGLLDAPHDYDLEVRPNPFPKSKTWKPGERVEYVRHMGLAPQPGTVVRVERYLREHDTLVVLFDDEEEPTGINPDVMRHIR